VTVCRVFCGLRCLGWGSWERPLAAIGFGLAKGIAAGSRSHDRWGSWERPLAAIGVGLAKGIAAGSRSHDRWNSWERPLAAIGYGRPAG